MRIDVFFTPHEINEDRLKDRTAVVVDVLRFSTTVCAALSAGAKEIIPADSIEAAIQLANNLSRDAILLCGEREGKLIPGFNLGNSPLEYTPKKVKGKTLVFGTTNGSPTLVKSRASARTVVTGFVNLAATVTALLDAKQATVIICAGKLGQFALEDAVCAGMIIHELLQRSKSRWELSDSARAAQHLYDRDHLSLLPMISECEHGSYLSQIGMQDDLPVCIEVNRLPVLPVFSEGKIHLFKGK